MRRRVIFSLCVPALAAGLLPAAAIAAFPGAPGPIAYSKTDAEEVGEGRVDEAGGLFTHGPRKSDRPRPLTTESGDHSPVYSADGRMIVFVHDDLAARTSSIYVMRSDGSERKQVTTGGADPYFFPSGRSIAFARRDGGDTHIYSIRIDGTGLRRLTDGPHEDTDPVVSPSGRTIAFSSDRDPDGRRDRSDIFQMRSNGSRLGVLVDGPRNEYEPDYSPDGRRIAFISNRANGPHVHVAGIRGAGFERQLTTCRDVFRCRKFSHPAFSPDGRHIVARSGGGRSSGIEVMRSDGRGSYISFDDAGTEEEGFGSRLGDPTWGPRPR